MTLDPKNRAQLQPVHPGLEALDDSFCMLDSQWRVTYWNAAAERSLGLPREVVLGQVLWEVLPLLRESASWEQLREAQRTGLPRRYLDRHPSARAGYVRVNAAPVAEGGLAVHFRNAAEEIGGAGQHAALLESIRDGLVAVDSGWKIVFVNAAAESLLRISRSQAQGATLWALLPTQPAEIRECLRATMEDGLQRHLRAVRPAGRVFRGRVFDLWTYPLAGGGISILFEDVSERVQHETELARLAAEAQEANQAKSRFFAAISHELRTPLNAIVGYTHLLHTQTYGEMPTAAQRAASRASVCAEHLARLVDDVLLMTTAEIGRLPVVPSPIRLPDYLPEMVEHHRHQAEAKGLRFVLDLPADLPVLETDPQRLRQLLAALLSNAVKYTARGEVRLEVRPCEAGDVAPLDASYPLFPDPYLEFRVVDTGPGISAEDRERIFGPFEQIGDDSRSQSMERGTGLGLTVARQLAGLLHGEVELAQTSPRGSIFTLRLPLHFPRR